MKTKTSDSRAVWRKQKDNSSVLFLASCKKNCCPMPFLSGFMIAKIVFKLYHAALFTVSGTDQIEKNEAFCAVSFAVFNCFKCRNADDLTTT